jgi:hypothetical protein
MLYFRVRTVTGVGTQLKIKAVIFGFLVGIALGMCHDIIRERFTSRPWAGVCVHGLYHYRADRRRFGGNGSKRSAGYADARLYAGSHLSYERGHTETIRHTNAKRTGA